MKATWTTACLVAGALLVPVAGYAADTKETPSKTTESAKEVVSDSMITTKIKAEFASDKQVSAMNIKVDTDKGVVKLSGNAKSKDEADKAASIAKNTKGVVSVKNDIQVTK
jgi:hyperosmotically inducible periplasmic protein